jgi:hypothetical protein
VRSSAGFLGTAITRRITSPRTEPGLGVAAALLSDAERQVRANGHSNAWLAVVAGNARARTFYEQIGWKDEGPFAYVAAAENGPIAVPCHRYTKRL